MKELKGDWLYLLVTIFVVLLTAFGKVAKSIAEGGKATFWSVSYRFVFAILGGVIGGALASIWFEEQKMLQWIFAAAGSYTGEHLLEVIGGAIQNKIDLIFHHNKENHE